MMHGSAKDEHTCSGHHNMGGNSEEPTGRRHGLSSRIVSEVNRTEVTGSNRKIKVKS